MFDVAEYARLDDEERKNYVESMNTARDTYNQIAYARKEGIGIGLEMGCEKKACEIAQKMIAKGLDPTFPHQYITRLCFLVPGHP